MRVLKILENKRINYFLVGCLTFFLFIFCYEKYTIIEAQKRLDSYGLVMSPIIWEINTKFMDELVDLMISSENYEKVYVRYDPGKLWVDKSSLKSTDILDIIFNSYFRKVSLSTKVIRSGEVIGSVDVVWVNKNIFVYIWVFIFIGLIVWIANNRYISARDKKFLQAKLIQSARLASLGEMAAGIAHELNNPLTSTMGFSDLIRKKRSIDRAPEYAEKIYQSADRMRKIIDQMKMFSKNSRNKWSYVNINDVATKTLQLYAQKFDEYNISVKKIFGCNVGTIWGCQSELESLFLHFYSNSLDAFEELSDKRERVIIVETRQNQKGKILISYQDNAGGIQSEKIDYIFDPFFTTKDVGKGAGLGLSIAHSIVARHKGIIDASSREGEGTKFEIHLEPDYVSST